MLHPNGLWLDGFGHADVAIQDFIAPKPPPGGSVLAL